MIEYTLEELISFKMSLAYEFNPDSLKSGALDIGDAIGKTKKYFLDNEEFVKTYEQNIKGFNLVKDIDDVMPLAIMYAYYYGLDYNFRKSGKAYSLNTAYLKECISPDKLEVFLTPYEDNAPVNKEIIDREISLRLSEFYDYMRKQKRQFFTAVRKIQDPMHANPYFKQEENDFLGQIPKYFRKIFNVEYSQNGKNDLDQINAVDLLPALCLGAISVSDLLPTSSKTKSGSLNFNRLEKIDRILKNRIEIAKDVDGCKQTDLLYKLAVEDLFLMNRLNNTITKYLDFNLEHKYRNHTKYQEVKLLRGIFAPYLFLPSLEQQEKYYSTVSEAADMLSKGEVSSREVFNKILPAFFSGNILFPQILVVLSNFLFTDDNSKILSEDCMKDRISLIEEYICANQEKISSHICDGKPHLWEMDEEDNRYIEIKKENKGFRKGEKYDDKTETRYSYQKEIKHKFTKLDIEKISRYLIEPEFKWKCNTITDRNTGLREHFENMKIDWHNNYAFHRQRGHVLEVDTIVSTDYFIFLSLMQFENVVKRNVQIYDYSVRTEDFIIKVPMF